MSQPSSGAKADRRRPAQDPVARRSGQDRAGRAPGVASSPAADEEHVRRRRLGQVAVGREEQRVVGAGRAGLDAGVDVVGPRRRLQRRQRVLRVAPDAARDEMEPAARGGRRRRRHRPRLDRRSSASGCSSGGSRPRPKNAPRDTVIRTLASPSGPPRPSAASSSSIARRDPASTSSGSGIAEAVGRSPEPGERARRARSAGRRGRGASRRRRRRAGSRDRTPRGWAPSAGTSRPSIQTWPGPSVTRRSLATPTSRPPIAAERAARLRDGLVPLGRRVAAVRDPAADVEREPRPVGDERPDEDRRRHRPVRPDPAERAGVRPAADRLELSRISIARIFGAPVIEPPGNDAASRSNASRPGASWPVTVETRCWTAAVRSSRQRRGTRTVPGPADPAEVVAQDVDDHHVLGPVLRATRAARRRGRGPRRASGRAAACP